MTHVQQCETCDGRDRAGFMQNGQCRECQDIERPERSRFASYHSPDAIERHGDAIAQREQESRNRVVNNDY